MRRKIFLELTTIVMILTLSGVIFVSAQEKQDEPPIESREIKSLDFQKKRIKAGIDGTGPGTDDNGTKKTAQNGGKRPLSPPRPLKPKQTYAFVKRIPRTKKGGRISQTTVSGQKPSPKPSFKAEEVGVTFWKLRPKKKGEENAPSFPVTIGGVTENWTAARVNSQTRFNPGDRVRFTIESSRAGFLYIVNREFYKDGAAGKPSLIYPTLRNRGGENSVEAGVLVDVPSGASFFNVTTDSEENYAGEELLIIISPIKINLPFEIGLNARELAPSLVEKWLDQWETVVDVFDGKTGVGVAYTKAEAGAVAGEAQSRSLTQEEPVPQTLYRVWTTGKDQILLIPVRMMAQKFPE
jgi:hypothetical protein